MLGIAEYVTNKSIWDVCSVSTWSAFALIDTAGLIGVNLWPQELNRRYLLCPRSMFCEFISESSLDEEAPPTLLMEEVKEGENYELLVTNASGLFRFVSIYKQD